jgi:opacity protein-like surface antigen
MKKLCILSAIMIAMTISVSAQDEGAAYSKGSSTLSAGYGFGNVWKHLFKLSGGFFGGDYKVTSTGPFSLTYEYGASDHISAGIAVSYSQVKGVNTDASDPTNNYTDKLTNFSIIARGNYHFGSSEKFDPYIGLGVGYYNFKYETKYSDGTSTGNAFAIPGAFGFNGQLGAKYYFAPSFGIFAEVGYVAGGFGQVGITAKF